MNNRVVNIQSLQIIWFGILAGALAFTLVTLIMTSGNIKPLDTISNNVMTVLAAVLSLGSFLAGRLLYSKKIGNINMQDSVEKKMEAYAAAFITRLALVEGPTLFVIVVFLLSQDSILIILIALLLVVMIMYFPSATRIGSTLSLSENELSGIKGKFGRN